jgi:hypothetical protein
MQNLIIDRIKSAPAVVAARSDRSAVRISKGRNAAIAGLLLLPLLAGVAHAHQAGAGVGADAPLAAKVRDAGARFVDVAVAKSEGYAPIPCTSGIDGGAMGIHFVNQKLIDDPAIDLAHPEAVMYEPDADGKMNLIAVEYITPKGPAMLGGQLFSFTNAPNRYGLPAFFELHVWAWKANAKGPFADFNPDVSCAYAPME